MTGKHELRTEPAPSIEQQREELAQTVAALAAKADVPVRVQESANEKVDAAKQFVSDRPEVVAASTAAAVVVVIAAAIIKRRRAQRRFARDVWSLLNG